jgi:hypothetical protein
MEHPTGGETMRRTLGLVLVAFLISSFAVAAQEEVAAEEAVLNLSAERTIGIGMQLDFPFGGLLSGRYWFSDEFGAEAIVFFWGYSGDVEGTITARALYRVADRPVVDFYAAFGASQPIEPYGWEPMLFSFAGGIEFGFRFAPTLAWNIEFGMAYVLDGELSMLFGTGIHFYF